MKKIEEVEKKVKTKLSEKRFYHSQCVKKRCKELAKIYDINIEKAELVGIAHDIAKEMTKEEKLEYVKKNYIEIDEIEKINTGLLHAKIGADICGKEFGFTEDMKKAIESHTTGKEDMDMLAKILFISDATGEDRKWEEKDKIAKLSEKNIDKAIIYCLNFTIKDILEKDKLIHIDTIKTRNFYLIKNSTN